MFLTVNTRWSRLSIFMDLEFKVTGDSRVRYIPSPQDRDLQNPRVDGLSPKKLAAA
jgi:hypothetical protein